MSLSPYGTISYILSWIFGSVIDTILKHGIFEYSWRHKGVYSSWLKKRTENIERHEMRERYIDDSKKIGGVFWGPTDSKISSVFIRG